MAWSFAALASYETARLALDKPLVAAQKIPSSPTTCRWNTAGTCAAADQSDTSYPARNAYDGFPGFATKTDGTLASTWYLVFDLGSAFSFDCAFIVGHNFGTLSLTTVELYVADDSAFTTSLTKVADFGTPSDDGRLQDLALDHAEDLGRAHDTAASAGPNRYTSQYVRLKLSRGSNFTPSLGELILGRRRQLQFKPMRPFDEYAFNENAELEEYESGLVSKYNYARRGFSLNGNLWVTDSTYRDDLVGFFRDCRGSMVWIDNPNSAPASFHMMMRNGPLSIPRVKYGLREHVLTAVEQGPESYYLDVEENG